MGSQSDRYGFASQDAVDSLVAGPTETIDSSSAAATVDSILAGYLKYNRRIINNICAICRYRFNMWPSRVFA